MSPNGAILWCTRCGASTALVDKTTHERNCRFGSAAWTSINPHRPSAKSDVANSNLANVDVANDERAPGRNRASSTYRYRNAERRRAYQRDLMRQRRATGRAA